jgi:hypothetical protein
MDYSEWLREGETLETVSSNTLKKRKHDAQQKASRKIGSDVFDSKTEITENQARDILVERGVKHQHTLDTILSLAEIAQQHFRLPYNKYLFTHGLRAALQSKEVGVEQEAPVVEVELVVGELINRVELHALWNYGFFREEMSFEDWLALRHSCKTSAFTLGHDVLEKDFHDDDGPHGNWTRFFPQFDPDTLTPGYSQEQSKAWMAKQNRDGKKSFLLMATRNGYKSSFAIVWLITAILCLPDVRALLVSETKPLSKGFIRSVRSYFEVSDKREPTRFQQLFPEHTIPVGDGSTLSFGSPMSRLKLIQSTAESTSMDSTVAGARADIVLFDDPISNMTVGNPEMIQASIDKHDLILKLKEVGGLSVVIGTPWSVADLYATLIDRATTNPNMGTRLDPAWTVKAHVKPETDVRDLREEDVTLLFPSRLSWAFLQEELNRDKKSTKFFRSQNLIEFVESDEAKIKVVFNELMLRANVVNNNFPTGEVAVSVDRAFSMSSRADQTCLTAAVIYSGPGGVKSCMVLDQVADRLRPSELVEEIIKITRKFNPRWILVESGHSDESLRQQVQQAEMKFQMKIPLKFVGGSSDNRKDAKVLRIKEAELLLNAGRLKFKLGIFNGPLFEQMVQFDVSKVKSRPNDLIDSLSLILHEYRMTAGPATMKDVDPEAAQRAQDQKNRLDAHQAIFGTAESQSLTSFQKQQPQQAPAAKGKWAAFQQARSEALRRR